jgi:hypothetical protein
MDGAGPVEIYPPNGKEHKWLTFKYANGVLMYHVLHTKMEDVPQMLERITFVGTEGRVGLWYGGLTKTDPPSLMHEKIGPDEIHLHQCPPGGHERGDFLGCVRTRQKPGADIEIGHRTVSVSHLAHITYRLGRPLKWDPAAEQFIDDEEANRMCSRAMREPWRL